MLSQRAARTGSVVCALLSIALLGLLALAERGSGTGGDGLNLAPLFFFALLTFASFLACAVFLAMTRLRSPVALAAFVACLLACVLFVLHASGFWSGPAEPAVRLR